MPKEGKSEKKLKKTQKQRMTQLTTAHKDSGAISVTTSIVQSVRDGDADKLRRLIRLSGSLAYGVVTGGQFLLTSDGDYVEGKVRSSSKDNLGGSSDAVGFFGAAVAELVASTGKTTVPTNDKYSNLLHIAATSTAGNPSDCVTAILGLGEDPQTNLGMLRQRDQLGQTPLVVAASRGSHETFFTLLAALNKAELAAESPSSVNVADDDKRTAAWHVSRNAAMFPNPERALEELVKNKADLNLGDEDGNTPLHNAAVGRSSIVASCLVKLGANMDPKNQKGQTPLIAATLCSASEVSTFLVDVGADHLAQDESGQSYKSLTRMPEEESDRLSLRRSLLREMANFIDEEKKFLLDLDLFDQTFAAPLRVAKPEETDNFDVRAGVATILRIADAHRRLKDSLIAAFGQRSDTRWCQALETSLPALRLVHNEHATKIEACSNSFRPAAVSSKLVAKTNKKLKKKTKRSYLEVLGLPRLRIERMARHTYTMTQYDQGKALSAGVSGTLSRCSKGLTTLSSHLESLESTTTPRASMIERKTNERLSFMPEGKSVLRPGHANERVSFMPEGKGVFAAGTVGPSTAERRAKYVADRTKSDDLASYSLSQSGARPTSPPAIRTLNDAIRKAPMLSREMSDEFASYGALPIHAHPTTSQPGQGASDARRGGSSHSLHSDDHSCSSDGLPVEENYGALPVWNRTSTSVAEPPPVGDGYGFLPVAIDDGSLDDDAQSPGAPVDEYGFLPVIGSGSTIDRPIPVSGILPGPVGLKPRVGVYAGAPLGRTLSFSDYPLPHKSVATSEYEDIDQYARPQTDVKGVDPASEYEDISSYVDRNHKTVGGVDPASKYENISSFAAQRDKTVGGGDPASEYEDISSYVARNHKTVGGVDPASEYEDISQFR